VHETRDASEQRYRAVLEVLDEGVPVTVVARRYGFFGEFSRPAGTPGGAVAEPGSSGSVLHEAVRIRPVSALNWVCVVEVVRSHPYGGVAARIAAQRLARTARGRAACGLYARRHGHDEKLAGRIRQLIASDPALTEEIFGGPDFLIA
jgi:hypothetical protein